MANPKDPSAYPRLFWDMVESMQAGTLEPVVFTSPTKSNAAAKRSYFSGFRSALKGAYDRTRNDAYLDKHNAAKQIKSYLEETPDGWKLTFSPKRAPDWLSGLENVPSLTAPTQDTSVPTPSLTSIDELTDRRGREELAKNQIQRVIRHWHTELFLNQDFLNAADVYEKIAVIQPLHLQRYGVDIDPLLNDHPLEDLGI